MNSSGALVSTSPLVNAINCVKPGGNTAYANALDAANTELETHGRPGVQKVIVLLSDGAAKRFQLPGRSDHDRLRSHQEVGGHQGSGPTLPSAVSVGDQRRREATSQAGVLVYTILYGDQSNAPYCTDYDLDDELPRITPQSALQQIASPGDYYLQPTPTGLVGVFQSIFTNLTATVNQP